MEHPALAPFLARLTPAMVVADQWGDLALEIAVYAVGEIEMPDVVTAAARCLVVVDGDVLLCETPRDVHVLPGGQIEAGETLAETARREVREETGWLVRPESMRMLGFVHFHHVEPMTEPSRFPNPDFLHAVFTGTARGRLGEVDEDWVDTEGWEQRSTPVPVPDALAAGVGPVDRVFLGCL